MRKPVVTGMAVFVFCIITVLASAQQRMTAAGEQTSSTKIGVSDEKLTMERDGNTLTLYWEGWINFVKPGADSVALNLRFRMQPTGQWVSRPKSRRVTGDFATGVNSKYQKIDIGQFELKSASSGNQIPLFSEVFEKDQTIRFRLTLTGAKAGETGPALDEVVQVYNPLGFGLLQAAQAGDTAKVTELLNLGAEPDAADSAGWSALMTAASRGDRAILQALLDKGADVNAKTKGYAFVVSDNGSPLPGGTTALMAASYSGHADIVRTLLEKGANIGDLVNRLVNSGASYDEVGKLILDGGSVANGADRRLADKLMSRKDLAYQMAVRRLLAESASFENITTLFDRHGASYSKLARHLREEGSNFETIVRLFAVRGPEYEDIVKLLRDRGLIYEEIVKLLENNGKDYNKFVTILIQTTHPRTDVVKLLLEKDVPYEDIVAMVQRSGASREDIARGALSKIPRHDDIARLVVKRGVSYGDFARFVATFGGSVDARRSDKWGPLMLATFQGNADVLNILLEEGADPQATSEAGYSAYALASINGNTQVQAMLKARGAVLKVPWSFDTD